MPRTVLILGGTRFLGRAITDAALGRGDQVRLFNRGLSGADLYPGLETIIGDRTGDRTGDLSALAGRYVFVSTVSVYADQSTPQAEDGTVIELRDGLEDPGELYGATGR
jgi:2'-hydroxyisoflavone reductase